MERRDLLAMLAQVAMPLDERATLTEWFGDLAARLSQEDSAGFLRAFRKDMPGRTRLEVNVVVLLKGYAVSSTVDVREIVEEGERRNVRLDWRLAMRPKEGSVVAATRRKIVEFRLERDRKGWRVLSLDDPDFFAPPAPGQ